MAASEAKFELSTWLPECPADAAPAVCELIPCGHFISVGTARTFARLIRERNDAASPNLCPMCRQRWREIRCLSVERSVERIRQQLEGYTRDIPDGPLRIWFQQILHFFISRNNALDEDLKQAIGKCLVDQFIRRKEGGQEESKGEEGKMAREDGEQPVLVLTNDQEKIIQLIQCVESAVDDWIKVEFGDRDKAIAKQKEGPLSAVYEGSPLQWFLESSNRLSAAAIRQVQTTDIPKRVAIVSIESILSRLQDGISSVAGRAAQVPNRIATVALATACLMGAASVYKNVDRGVCSGLSTAQERGPDVPLRGKWEGFKVCEDRTFSFVPDFCCDPRDFSIEKGACGTDKYHSPGEKENIYSGPEIDFKDKRLMEPGRQHDCDTSVTAKCVGHKAAMGAICALTGDDDCDTSGGMYWDLAEGAEFKPTEYGPGPLLPSEQQLCQDELTNLEIASLVGVAASIGVLLYGLYKACTDSSWSTNVGPDLVGDDTLVITPNGREHMSGEGAGGRGGRKKRSTARKRKKTRGRPKRRRTNKRRRKKRNRHSRRLKGISV